MAEVALERYDLDVISLELAGRATNLIYRVRTSDGVSYALRLASPSWRTLSDLQSEAMWLEALARDTVIPAPRIIRAPEGAAVVVCLQLRSHSGHMATLVGVVHHGSLRRGAVAPRADRRPL